MKTGLTKNRCAAMVLAAAALWGMIGIFVKGLSSYGLSSMQIIAVRCAFAAVFMLSFVVTRDKNQLKIRPRDSVIFIGTGIVSLVFFNWCYFGAMRESSLAVAAVLLYTAPIFVVLMSAAVFKEKLTAKKLLALLLTFLGCALVSGVLLQSESIGIKALLLGLGSGFGYALYSIFSRFALVRYTPVTITLYTVAFAALGSMLICFFEGGEFFPTVVFSGMKPLLLGVGISLISCALPYMLYTSGLSGIESGKASIMATLEPAVAALIGVFCFGEQISALNMLGMAFIFSSVIMLSGK